MARPAFTIVELLIVIVIIGILAAIISVSYTGIRERATAAALQSDLRQAATLLEIYKTENETYPSSLDDLNDGNGFESSSGNSFDYDYNSGSDTFSLTASDSSGTIAYYITSENTTPTLVSGGGSPVPISVVAWGGTAGLEEGRSVIQTTDGGYAIAGTTESYGAGDSDAFLAKYTSDGTLSWSKTWGGADYDEGYSVVQTTDGGYVVAGDTHSYDTGGGDMFLAKYTNDGTLSWNKTWGGIGNDYGYSVVQTTDGGCVVAGGTTSYGAGGQDMFLAKYTSDGTLSWNKTWGGTSYDYGYSVIQTTDGGYAVTGETASYDTGGGDMFLAKYTSDGTLSWSKTWGGIDTDYGYSVVQTTDGGYAMMGMTNSYGAGDYDIFLAKYTSDGTLSWSKTWGGIDTDYGYSVVQTTDGGYAMTGETYNYGAGNVDMFLAKYTSDGTLSWSKTWGGTSYDYGYSVVQTTDGGYAVTGRTSSYGAGHSDMFLAKYTSDGSITNCSSPMCQSPTATVTSPTATVSSPTATVTYPTATVSSPTATVTSPTATTTQIFPIVPPPTPDLVFSAQELYVAYPGEDMTGCKTWSATGGNTISGFFVTQATEEDYDYFIVSADSVEVYNQSGYVTDYYVDISGSPATTLEACVIADEIYQDGFGGEVTGVVY